MSDQATMQELQNLMKEILLSQKETAVRFKETDKKFKASQKELDTRFKETDAQIKETTKQLKKAHALFTTQWGKLVESLVEGEILKLFNQHGIQVQETSLNRKRRGSSEDWEFDIIAHDGKEIVIIEVKTTLRVKDVTYFDYKLSKAKEWLKEYSDNKIYGAMAYLKADQGSDRLAEKKGMFVIRATGDSASIVNPLGFRPRIW